VFHLAAKVHDLDELKDTGEHEAVTVRGTQNLLAAAGKNGVKRFLFLSSLSVYGADTESMRDESAACEPISAYGRAKLQAEQCVFEQGAGFGMHVCCLRPSMVYGRGCKGNLPRLVRMIDRGLFPPLPDLGNRRSVLHVANAVDATLLAATHPAANGQCYIVTDAQAYSTRELYETICRGLEKRIPRWQVPVGPLKTVARMGDAIGRIRGKRFMLDSDALDKLLGSAWYSTAKISRELGYRPTVTLAEALPELIQAYRNERAR
jgi:nucleoside-diphosphate-sugar epimerase